MGDLNSDLSLEVLPFLSMLPHKALKSIFDLGGLMDVSPCLLGRLHLSNQLLVGGTIVHIIHGSSYHSSILDSTIQMFFLSWVMEGTYVNPILVMLANGKRTPWNYDG
jgi:hypothetical protein